MPSKYEKRIREKEKKRLAEEWDWLQQNQERSGIDDEDLKQQGDMEEGNYLQDPMNFNQIMQIKGNLMGGEGSKINPDKKPLTEREKQRQERLRKRAGSGQQGADIAKKKLPPGALTDLPQFLQVSDPQAGELAEYDRLMREADALTGKEKIDKINEANRARPDYRNPVHQLGNLAKDTWEEARTFKDFRNPMNLGWNIGALGARGVEAIVPTTKEELMFELVTLGQGKKLKVGRKIGAAIFKDILDTDVFNGVYKTYDDIARSLTRASDEGLEYAGIGRIDDLAEQSAKTLQIAGEGFGTSSSIPPKVRKLFDKYGLKDEMSVFWKEWEEGFKLVEDKRNFMAYLEDSGFSRASFTKTKNELLPQILEEFSAAKKLDPSLRFHLHHINALKSALPMFEGMRAAERADILKIIMKEGLFAGHNPKNLQMLPEPIHVEIHSYLSEHLGKFGQKFFNKKGLQGLSYDEKVEMVRGYANIINESQKQAYSSLAGFKDATTADLTGLVKKRLDTIFNQANLEELILTGKTLPGYVSPEVKQIVNPKPSRIKKKIRKIDPNKEP